MRDNAKGGALLQKSPFYILLSLYAKHGYAVMQFIEENRRTTF